MPLKKSLKQTKIQNQGCAFMDLTWLPSVGLAQLWSSPFSPSVWLAALLWRSQIGSAFFFFPQGKLPWEFRCLVLQFAGLCEKADSWDDLGEKEDITPSTPHQFISWTNSVIFLGIVTPRKFLCEACLECVLWLPQSWVFLLLVNDPHLQRAVESNLRGQEARCLPWWLVHTDWGLSDLGWSDTVAGYIWGL